MNMGNLRQFPVEGIPSDRNNDMVISCGRNSFRQE
jgi:hypothetical protein